MNYYIQQLECILLRGTRLKMFPTVWLHSYDTQEMAKLPWRRTNLYFSGLMAGVRRNINNRRYTDDTTIMAESEEELKSLLMKVKKESEKASLKLNIQKTKIMAPRPITSWQIDGEKIGNSGRFFLGLQNHCGWWLQPWN